MSQSASGFEAYNASNITLYNANYGNASHLFNAVAETGGSSFYIFRATAGVDYGVGYTFSDLYYFTDIRIRIRPDCCDLRSGGGEFRVYRDGTLVATSPMITYPGSGDYTTNFAPNIVGDEVRYIFPNGVDTQNNDGIPNFTELEITGHRVR